MNKEKILEILGNVIGKDTEELLKMSVETKLSDIGLTSIGFIQFVVAIEDEFKIEILDSDLLLSNFETIAMLYKTLEKYFSLGGALKKVLICDCDNVLWHGIVGEEEIYTDSLTAAFQEAVTDLYNRGVIICICSKNQSKNVELAFETLEMPLRKEHILISKVNLTDKATNISEIARELNLSADSFVFVDDSQYELDLVSSIIPEITTVRADYSNTDFIEQIKSYFKAESTSFDRTQQYREQKEREKEKQRFSTAEEFNASLKTEVKCDLAAAEDALRIAELSQRTNQFNLSASRYTESEITDFISSDRYAVYILSVLDKYGDMGTVGAVIVNKVERPIIISFFLSCRVFGRDFEKILIEKIKADFSGSLKGVYKETDKNKLYRNFFAENGVEIYE